jgi:hypothetical protein
MKTYFLQGVKSKFSAVPEFKEITEVTSPAGDSVFAKLRRDCAVIQVDHAFMKILDTLLVDKVSSLIYEPDDPIFRALNTELSTKALSKYGRPSNINDSSSSARSVAVQEGSQSNNSVKRMSVQNMELKAQLPHGYESVWTSFHGSRLDPIIEYEYETVFLSDWCREIQLGCVLIVGIIISDTFWGSNGTLSCGDSQSILVTFSTVRDVLKYAIVAPILVVALTLTSVPQVRGRYNMFFGIALGILGGCLICGSILALNPNHAILDLFIVVGFNLHNVSFKVRCAVFISLLIIYCIGVIGLCNSFLQNCLPLSRNVCFSPNKDGGYNSTPYQLALEFFMYDSLLILGQVYLRTLPDLHAY